LNGLAARPTNRCRLSIRRIRSAQIWLDGSSLVAGIKLLLGIDPKKDYRDKVVEVTL
jgi:hypothetical protein